MTVHKIVEFWDYTMVTISLVKLWERDISKQGGVYEIYYPLKNSLNRVCILNCYEYQLHNL